MASAVVLAGLAVGSCASDGDGGAVPGFPDDSVPVEVREGADIYRARCASCHGSAGEGGPIGPPVDSPDMWDELGEEGVRAVIVDGAEGMPAYGDVLTDDEVDAVVAYLRALSERDD